MHLHLMHINYIILGIAFLVLLVFLQTKWDFVSKACSDGGSPSATRLCGFIFTLCVSINETYTTLRTQKFDTEHLKLLLVAIGVLFGIIKITEIMGIWKGGINNPAPQQTLVQQQVNKKEENITTNTLTS